MSHKYKDVKFYANCENSEEELNPVSQLREIILFFFSPLYK